MPDPKHSFPLASHLEPRCVLVLGSHRSGTSVLMRALSAVGVYQDDALMPANSFNAKGYFEDMVAYQINEKFLGACGRCWHTLANLGDVDQQIVLAYQKDIFEKIFPRFRLSSLWGLKDPRISRLWAYWMPAFASASIGPVFVLANRHPLSVASSLAVRERMPQAHAFALWALHQLDGFEALLLHGGLVVDYDLLMGQPLDALHRIASFLGVADQLDGNEIAKFQNEFLADDLRHTHFESDDVRVELTPLQALCLDLYSVLHKLAQLPGGLTPEAVAQSQPLLARYRNQLATCTDWMQAIDALQVEVSQIKAAEASGLSGRERQAQLYFSEVLTRQAHTYDESHSCVVSYPVTSKRQTLRLVLPAVSVPIVKLRLDPANAPVALRLHGITLVLSDGVEIWRWDGTLDLFVDVSGLVIRQSSGGVLLLCLDHDPRFQLVLPAAVLAKLRPNACLMLDVTPQPILDALPEVLAAPVTLADKATTRTIYLSEGIAEINHLIDANLAQRDLTIAQQAMQIRSMREELIRAEAQLDLLKDLFLDGQQEERL